MSTLRLVQSGGMMGKARSAQIEIDMKVDNLYDALKEIESDDNPLARDGFNYTAHIGGEPEEDGVKIDPGKAKGPLKQALTTLIKNLKV